MKKGELDAGNNSEAQAFPGHFPGVSPLELSHERRTCLCLQHISDYSSDCAQSSRVTGDCRRQSTELCVPAQPDTGDTHGDVTARLPPGFAPLGRGTSIKLSNSKMFWSLKAHLSICLPTECTQLLIQTHAMVHGFL